MTLRLRPASADDAQALATFGEATFRDAFAADNTAENMNQYCAESFSVARLHAELTGSVFTTLVGYVDSRLAAYVQLTREKHPSCLTADCTPGEIRRIYVDRRDQGHGFGRQLIDASVHELSVRGCDCVWLAVWEHNHSAMRFYDNMGFRPVGDAEFMLGDELQNDLILARPIDD
ncbi:MAG: GNAT family N-acetyltransferase [Pseudomonadota bacterium]